MTDWFEKLFGFAESPQAVRRYLHYDGERLHSRANDRSWRAGRLCLPSLGELRQQLVALPSRAGGLRVDEIVADSKLLHADPAHADALFQVASQFNLLEMIGPCITPEQGISRYGNDPTQGPACAMACAAGTLVRNYFAFEQGGVYHGQSESRQIDTLNAIGEALDNAGNRYWRMQNGYALFEAGGAQALDARLQNLSCAERDSLKARLRLGVQWQTEVTLPGGGHTVNQVYCSALPVAYIDSCTSNTLEGFARLILEAAYEATLALAQINALQGGCHRVFLTALGGGAFGNDTSWISDAMQQAFARFDNSGLHVSIVNYQNSNDWVRELLHAHE